MHDSPPPRSAPARRGPESAAIRGAAPAAILAVAAALPLETTAAWLRHTIDRASQGADGVRLADADQDGRLDIATGWEEGGCVRLCLQPEPAAIRLPWPGVTVGRVPSPEDAVPVDLDGDGAFDVVSCCEGKTRSVFVHWGPPDPGRQLDPDAWRTEPIPAAAGRQQWMFCVPLQVDGRHGPDLVAGGKGAGAEIGWLEAPAAPRDLAAWRWHPLAPVAWTMSLVPHDIDQDGDADILFSERRGAEPGCRWLENPGPGPNQSMPWPMHRIGAPGDEPMFICLADLDQDGAQDVVSAVLAHKLLWHRRRAAAPPRWETIAIPTPAEAGLAKAAAVGDIDGDGRPDIAFTCESAESRSGVMWLAAPDAGWLATPLAHDVAGAEGVKYDLLALIDLDGDADLDIITCEERDNLGLIWYENPMRNVNPAPPLSRHE